MGNAEKGTKTDSGKLRTEQEPVSSQPVGAPAGPTKAGQIRALRSYEASRPWAARRPVGPAWADNMEPF